MGAALLQLDPALQVKVLHNGEWHKAWCHGWMDYGVEADLFWICFLDSNGEPWIVNNKFIRAQTNITIGRRVPTLPSGKTES